jgi:hypothetical protein
MIVAGNWKMFAGPDPHDWRGNSRLSPELT